MNWKDAVLSSDRARNISIGVLGLDKVSEMDSDLAFDIGRIQRLSNEAQAEASFKAGIKEVVGWINKTYIGVITKDQMVATNTWQAKLKEWEVSDDN